MRKIMDQEMMQLKHELKEVVEKGQHILQKMDGMVSQRMYGMRGGQQSGYSGNIGSGGYNGGQGGNMGQRENWQMNPMQQGFPQQGMFPQQGFQQGYPQQDMMQQMNPLWFL